MLYIHTYRDGKDFVVEWSTLNKAGFFNISVPADLQDAKATVEVFALAKLLERFPNLSSSVITAQGAILKLLKGVGREGTGEIGYLKVRYPDFSVKSSRKAPLVIASVLAKLDAAPQAENLEWQPLGRPAIQSPVGDLMVTEHSMARYRERVAPTGNLNRLEKFLDKAWRFVSESKAKPSEKALRHCVYSVGQTGFRVVVSEQLDGSRRLRTCYAF